MSSKAQKQAESNILTFLRVRPSNNSSGYFTQDELEPNSLSFNLPKPVKNELSEHINNSKLQHNFHFNGIIDANATQDEVFKKVGISAVQNAIEGFNSTIFAYGQTGSGKTFTLTGGPTDYKDRGIIPRAISMLYGEYRNRSDLQLKAYISYLELYNEKGYDLLDPAHDGKSLEELPKVTMLEDEHGNFHLKNLSMNPADTEEEALNLLFMGDTNRAIAETPMNMASSRSHCIFTISLEVRVVGSDKVRRSKLHLVDLAGSERVGKTNSSGSVLTEAKHINSSLFFLETVIVALYEKATKGRTHIPYRNSMMTSVLRDSLGGNCKTIMIATINPEASHTEESLSTCKFAQRVSLIKNKALLNEETDPSIIIRKLKDELLNLREEIAFLKGEAGEGDALLPSELEELKTQCRQYCFDTDPYSTLNIGPMTLTKIKDCFGIMKNLVLESANNPGNNNNNTNNVDTTEETAALKQQVKDLKSLLVQRDSEIVILVNMVQKGKTAEDVGQARQRASRGGGGGFNDDDEDFDSSPSGRSGGKSTTKNGSAGGGGGGGGGGGEQLTAAQMAAQAHQQHRAQRSYQEQQQLERMQREKENQERIIKRHLFGVPPPSDRNIFEDPAAALEWFKAHCSLNASMETNKAELKEKIAEAKMTGERANKSRSAINYLKQSIEDLRRERVLHRLNDSKSTADDASTGDQSQQEEESEAEATHRRAIDQEKTVYKNSFDRLRVLKPEIEHISKMIEKCRATMQSQFDQWYANLQARNGIVGSGNSSSSAHGSAYAYSEQPSTLNSTSLSASAPSSSTSYGNSGLSMSMSRDSDYSAAQPQQGSRRAPSQQYDAKAAADSKPPFSPRGQPGPSSNTTSSVRSSSNNSVVPPHLLAEGKDDDVNEDIKLFYQAKEEMLRRRGAN